MQQSGITAALLLHMKILKLLLALTALALTTGGSRADPLLGMFNYRGTGHMVGPAGFSYGTATGFDVMSLTITSAYGDFAALLNVGDVLTFASPWSFSDPTSNSFTVDSLTFSSDHYTYFQPATGITVTGGELTGVEGYLSSANFSFFDLQPDGSLTIAGAVLSGAGLPPGSGVPAGGATALLLLGSLAGLGLIRLRLA